MKKGNKKTIIAFTTDPYNNIYGYSLVFFKFFDYLQKTKKDIEVIFIANNGTCSQIVKNKKFIIKKLNKKMSILLKTVVLAYCFIYTALLCDKKSVILANCEIPELLAACILKIRFKKVYCLLQDTRVRDEKFSTRIICSIRLFLINRIQNVIFTNKFTLNTYKGKVNKFYIGNPIFT